MESSLFNQVGSALGILGITAVGAAGVAYWLFQTFSEKWISNKFNQQLSAAEHAHQKELQKLKLEVDRLLDRSVKLHQREFEVLPKIWGLAVDALHNAQDCFSAYQSYPDLESMNQAQLEAHLSELDLKEWEKDEIRRSDSKNSRYHVAISWDKLAVTRNSAREFFVFRKKNSVFLETEIGDALEHFENLIFNAIIETKNRFENHPHYKETKDTKLFQNEAPRLMETIEKKIRTRLNS